MKRFFSIAFIAILLLNIMGYYLIFRSIQYQSDIAMIKVLDADQYDPSQTFTIKIPVSIPYMNDRVDYERMDGKFEYRGEYYRMVKQRFDKDTLTVICVLDRETKRITEALSDYVTTFTDKPSTFGGGSKVTLSFAKDYLVGHFSISPMSTGWQATIIHFSGSKQFVPAYICSITHPPERN